VCSCPSAAGDPGGGCWRRCRWRRRREDMMPLKRGEDSPRVSRWRGPGCAHTPPDPTPGEAHAPCTRPPDPPRGGRDKSRERWRRWRVHRGAHAPTVCRDASTTPHRGGAGSGAVTPRFCGAPACA
jgi:hypothetical protein